MTLSEYKFIFWMEYGHRMWGRCIGAAFLLPGALMAARGYFPSGWLRMRVLAIGSLIGFQGCLGWYMVQSGLSRDNDNPTWVARVSQYRLAAHLGAAFTIYTLALEGAFRLLRKPLELVADEASAGAVGAHQGWRRLSTLRVVSKVLVGACFVTAVSGAFVAGMDAGLVYNTFPKFADRWIPSDILVLTPVQRNFTENSTTVQFQHRVLGITTASLVATTWVLAAGTRTVRVARVLTAADLQRLVTGSGMLLGMAGGQVGLGVATLLWFVPTPTAASHQAGSLVLLSLALWFAHLLRRVPPRVSQAQLQHFARQGTTAHV